jgi:hypothetical protein
MERRKLFLLIFVAAVVIFLMIKRNQSNMGTMFGNYQDGHVIDSLATTTFDRCKSMCDSNSKCAGFTLGPDNMCELKSKFPNIIDKKGYIVYKK